VWGFVEGKHCRRRAILRHFGDAAEPALAAGVPCCDVCEPSLVPAAAPRRGAPAPGAEGDGDLDGAIVAVVEEAAPSVGRTRAVEILRGGRSKVIREHSYDGLRPYGAFAHLSGDEVLARVDELLAAGRLRSTGGRFPKLEAA
jgi:ATP-dependent DNA helicase RecQ